MIGGELQLFVEKKEVSIKNEFAKYSGVELVQMLEQEARLLPEHHSGVTKTSPD